MCNETASALYADEKKRLWRLRDTFILSVAPFEPTTL